MEEEDGGGRGALNPRLFTSLSCSTHHDALLHAMRCYSLHLMMLLSILHELLTMWWLLWFGRPSFTST
jgi:hypothetical protein